MAFGSFTFIPIHYFSDSLNYVSFTKSYNIIFQLYDMLISILENKTLGLPVAIDCGLYIIKMQSDRFIDTQKLMLIK